MIFDVDKAMADGVSPTQIAEFLAQKKNFDIGAARKDGVNDTQIIDFLNKPEPKQNLLTDVQRGAEQLASSGQTAFESLYKTPEEYIARSQAREADINKRLGEQTPALQKVQDVYAEKGLFPAITTGLAEIPKAIAEQVPQIATTLTGARLGAGVGSFLGPEAALIGGAGGSLVGMFLPSFIQQYGGFLERQADVQKSEGKPLDINRGKAAAFAVPAGMLDVAENLIPFGGNVATKMFGPAVGNLLNKGLTKEAEQIAAKKLTEETFLPSLSKLDLGTVVKGTTKAAALEIPTEVAQQMLERKQAGLDLFSKDAYKEYGETAFDIALLGPLGIYGRVSDKAAARQTILKAQQEAAVTGEPQPATVETIDDAGKPEQNIFYVDSNGAVGKSLDDFQFKDEMAKRTAALNAANQPVIPPTMFVGQGAQATPSLEDAQQVEFFRQQALAKQQQEQNKITKDMFTSLGINANAKIVKSDLIGKDLSDPNIADQVRENLLKIQNFTDDPVKKNKIEQFLQKPEFNTAKVIEESLIPEGEGKFISVFAPGPNGYQSYKAKLDENKQTVSYVDAVGNIKKVKANDKNVLISPTEAELKQKEVEHLEDTLKTVLKERDAATGNDSEFTRKFKEWLRKNPLTTKQAQEVGVRQLYNKNGVALPIKQYAHKGYLSPKGLGSDELSLAAYRAGFLTDLEYANSQDTEGENTFMDMVRGVLEPKGKLQAKLSIEDEARARQADEAANNLQNEIDRRKQELESIPTEEQIGEQELSKEPIEPQPLEFFDVTPTTKLQGDIKKLQTRLKKSLDSLGLQSVSLKVNKNLQAMVNGEPTNISGKYFNKLIYVALHAPDPLKTLHHEAIHALKDLGFFSDAEWAVLEKAAEDKWIKKYGIEDRYKNFSREVQIEEAIANAFPDFMKMGNVEKTLYQRVKDFFSRVRNIFRGMGYITSDMAFNRTPEAVFQKVKEQRLTGNKQIVSNGLRLDKSNGIASFLPERLNKVLNSNTYTTNESTTKGYITYISPIDFLKATTTSLEHENEIRKEAGTLNREQLKKEFHEPHLEVEIKNGQLVIIGHEGRHRMAALAKEGIKKVPVIIIPSGGRIDNAKPIPSGAYFTKQYFRNAEKYGQSSFFNEDEILPLSYEYAKQVKEKFINPEADVRFNAEPTNQNFKNWFRNSKVVDDNGKPLVVYHGTNKLDQLKEAFTTFNTYGSEYGLFGQGSYFTDNPEVASSYTKKGKGETPTVYPVYLSLQNPIDMDIQAIKKDWVKTFPEVDFEDEYKPEKNTNEGFYRAVEQYYEDLGNYPKYEASERIQDGLRDMGYDGITHTGGGRVKSDGVRHQVYIAFEPEQIKSAIGNTGEYSTENPDIRYEISLPGVDPKIAAMAEKTFGKQEPKSYLDTLKDLAVRYRDRFKYMIADDLADLQKTSSTGYMKARLSKTIDTQMQVLLDYGQLETRGGTLGYKRGTKGLKAIYAPLGNEVERFQIWMALSRDAQLPTNKRSFKDELVNSRNQFTQGDLNGVPRLKLYEQVRAEQQALNKSVLNVAKDLNLIDDEAYKRFVADNFYIPFYKEMENGDIEGARIASKLTGQKFSHALKGGEKKVNDLMDNMLRNWGHIISASLKNDAALTTLKDAEKIGVAVRVKPNESGNPGVVKVMENGAPTFFKVMDQDLTDSISQINYLNKQSALFKAMTQPTNWLRYGVTLNPAYKIRNIVKDSLTTVGISDISANIPANIKRGWELSNKASEIYADALASGAVFQLGSSHDGKSADLIKRLIAEGVSDNTILNTQEKMLSGLKKAFKAYEDFGNRLENVNRMTLYDKLISEGKSPLEAAYESRDLLDFTSQGASRSLRVISQLVPFMNTRIQGLYKLYRTGTEAEKQKRLFYTLGSIALASALLYLVNKDDEDFKRRQDWDRDNFWWFKIGDTAFRIPKPYELGGIGTLAERGLEQFSDDSVESKVFFSRMGQYLMDTLSLDPTPQAIKPLWNVINNRDSFTGTPIETPGMERFTKTERYGDKTSGVAKGLSQVINMPLSVIGLENSGPSPVQIDYLAQGYFGWLGGTLGSTAARAFEDKPSKPLIDAIGFAQTEPEINSKYITDFYQSNAKIQNVFDDMKRYAEQGNTEKVSEILKEKGDLIALQKLYNQTVNEIAKQRKYIEFISNQNLPREEREQMIVNQKLIMSKMAENAENIRKSLKNK